MLVYKATDGIWVNDRDRWYGIDYVGWDELVCMTDAVAFLEHRMNQQEPRSAGPDEASIVPPIGRQEVWAAGVTYFRSRTARMEESQAVGGSDFYDRVYHADRPELFMKAAAHRVQGHRGTLKLRADSQWMVPEPELTLLLNPEGRIIGYTIGNDLSCRDIEGENPLYLPQAKTFDGCAALGPGVWFAKTAIPDETRIELHITRQGRPAFDGYTTLSDMKKKPAQLVGYLFHSLSFPDGCYLMTGTGIVPPDDFSLQAGDEIRISIDPIGTLVNRVE